ncbi:MAG: hypothetical protein V3T88_04720 [Nitrosomonadaceae bacterium]
MSILLFAVPSNVWAAFPYAMTFTVSAGDTILADHYNTANNEHINNNIPTSIDDYSTNVTQMQATSDPGNVGTESLATTAAGNFERLRFLLQEITQEPQWYSTPPTFCENSADYDHGTGDFTTGGKLVIDVDGTAINADGAITFGIGNDDSIYHNGTNLEIDTTTAIELSIVGTTEADLAADGFNVIAGDSYQINNASVLNATTLGSGVLASSLTSVGTLASPVLTSPVLNTAVSGTAVLDEDAMGSDSDTQLATQQSIKAYVDNNVSDITLGTEQASTSGTAIDFTSIPAGTKKITIMLAGVSTDGTEELLVQLGDSGGAETSGYLSVTFNNAGKEASTAGFLVVRGSEVGSVHHGAVILTLENSSAFTWVSSSNLNKNDSTEGFGGSGSKSLSAELDRVRITTTGTPDDFDAGVINIQYQ